MYSIFLQPLQGGSETNKKIHYIKFDWFPVVEGYIEKTEQFFHWALRINSCLIFITPHHGYKFLFIYLALINLIYKITYLYLWTNLQVDSV